MDDYSSKWNRAASSLISDARSCMMGVFIIVIMLFHNSFGALGPISVPFRLYGHWGVDAFLFLSGFGLYFSLKRTGHSGLLSFYKRRLVRIIPAAVVAGSILYVCGMSDWLGLLGLNLWYIRTVLVLYLLAPFIYEYMENWNATWILIFCTVLGVIGVLLSVPVLAHSGFVWQSTVSWTLARLPVFALGMYIARMNFSVGQLMHPAYILFAVLCLFAALYLHRERELQHSFSTYLHLLPYILVAFTMPLCMVLLALVIPTKSGGVILRLIGSFSLEFYLVHEAIFGKVSAFPHEAAQKFLVAYGLTAVAALALHYCCVLFYSLFHRGSLLLFR